MNKKQFEIEQAKRNLLIKRPICELCGNYPSMEVHHLFCQSKVNKKLYPEYIHHPKNLLCVCHSCHKYARNLSENEFCSLFNIKPRSKSNAIKNF